MYSHDQVPTPDIRPPMGRSTVKVQVDAAFAVSHHPIPKKNAMTIAANNEMTGLVTVLFASAKNVIANRSMFMTCSRRRVSATPM